MKSHVQRVLAYVRQHWKKTCLIAAAVILGGFVVVQIFYPGSRLLPFSSIDGQNVSAWKKDDATWQLDRLYAQQEISIMYGSRKQAYQTPKPQQIGLTVTNDHRLDQSTYPWWLRIVPTSLLWGHAVVDIEGPAYTRDGNKLNAYVQEELGDSCNVAPRNATLAVKDGKLKVIASAPDGKCNLTEVKTALAGVKPNLPSTPTVRIKVKETPAPITDTDAKAYLEKIERRLAEGIPLQVNNETHIVPQENLYEWLTFSDKDREIIAAFSTDKAKAYFDEKVAPKVTNEPGVTKVTTLDFQEVSREEGPTGTRLDLDATLLQLASFANNTSESASVVTAAVPARVVYTRNYSPTDEGLSALLANYAKDHPGRYGISLVELSGDRRRANYNGDMKFTTASTYKLYVAYSTLKRVESGKFNWGMNIAGGRNLETCFNDMIIKSDNACAEALVEKIGYRPLTDEAVAAGAKNTSFVDTESYKTTANDLAFFTAALESGQLLTGDSRSRLLSAMRQNIFRQGIPAGVGGQVANKVGFLDGFLHDAAIVYSPNGTYALSIMTEDSSWAHIAELSREIEKLHAK